MSGNPITWWEIQVPDLERAKAFYGGVFDWTFKPWRDGYEAVHTADGTMIGGLSHKTGKTAGRPVRPELRPVDGPPSRLTHVNVLPSPGRG